MVCTWSQSDMVVQINAYRDELVVELHGCRKHNLGVCVCLCAIIIYLNPFEGI